MMTDLAMIHMWYETWCFSTTEILLCAAIRIPIKNLLDLCACVRVCVCVCVCVCICVCLCLCVCVWFHWSPQRDGYEKLEVWEHAEILQGWGMFYTLCSSLTSISCTNKLKSLAITFGRMGSEKKNKHHCAVLFSHVLVEKQFHNWY